jgi:hypothetical protein
MFQYNPTVNDISGQIYGQGLERAAGYDAQGIQAQAEADLMRAQRQHQLILDGAQFVGDSAKKVAAFLVGGPAGAAMASGGGGGGGGGGDLIGSLISSFANKKAMDAKDKAYMGFFERHGEDLGFDGDYLAQLKNMDRDERVAAFDLMTGQPGQRLGSLNYLEAQMGGGGGGAARGTGGGGAGGGQKGYIPGQGWVGYGN